MAHRIQRGGAPARGGTAWSTHSVAPYLSGAIVLTVGRNPVPMSILCNLIKLPVLLHSRDDGAIYDSVSVNSAASFPSHRKRRKMYGNTTCALMRGVGAMTITDHEGG